MFRPSLVSWIALASVFLVLGLILGNVALLTGAVFVGEVIVSTIGLDRGEVRRRSRCDRQVRRIEE